MNALRICSQSCKLQWPAFPILPVMPMILPANCPPHFQGLAGTNSYKNKDLSLRKATCLPPKRVSGAMARSPFFAEKEAFGTNLSSPLAEATSSIPTNSGHLEM
jgi:hypothetical protein